MAAPQTNRPCAKCGHWRMYLLKNFVESDINASPTSEGFGARINLLHIITALINAGRGAASVDAKRAKLRKLRAETLPRAPNTLVCPNCMEAVERF